MLFINHTNDADNVLGKKYNVEYSLGNGKIKTFSNVLQKVDDGYFWFCNKEEGLDIIKEDRIMTMVCIRESYFNKR